MGRTRRGRVAAAVAVAAAAVAGAVLMPADAMGGVGPTAGKFGLAGEYPQVGGFQPSS